VTPCPGVAFAGAGGGGYYGGGGGGEGTDSAGGGGAGSSFWVSGATGTSMSEDTTGTPEVQITPVTTADLALSDSAPATAVSGNSYSYTLTATNTGGTDATGTLVTDTLPDSTHYDSVTTSQGTCARTPPSTPPKTKGGTVTCAVGSLAAGASVTVTITVTATTPGAVSDNAKVTASNVTPDSDDTASASTTVQGT
jgi:uncharacterized repeat protein (TIGR01451 family)